MNLYLRAVVLGIALFVPTQHALSASPPGTILQTFVNPDRPSAPNSFGADIATYQDTVFISDPFTPEGGAVYQFNRNGTLIRSIYHSGAHTGARFGDEIAIVGNHLVVGATFETLGASAPGAVYVYSAITGAFERRIDSPSPVGAFQQFGQSFASVGNAVIIGNSNHSVPMFNVDTGQLIREFQSPGGSGGNFFGEEVAAADNRVFVAAPQETQFGAGTGNGVIHVYNTNTGVLERTMGGLLNESNRLGSALTMSGDNLLAGDFSTNQGHAYLFDTDTGNVLRTFQKPAGTDGAWYGTPIAAMGEFDVIGSNTFQLPGSVYFYDGDGDLTLTIAAPIQNTNRNFANRLTPWGNNLLVGAPDNANGSFGIVYLFSTPVPEPSALALASISMLALVGISRRRRQRRVT